MEELENFELELQQANHKAIIAKLTSILKKLDNQPSIENEVDVSGIEKAIKSITLKAEISAIPKSIELIGKSIISKIENIKEERPSEWIFDISRNKQGLINKVNAKSK